VKHVTQHTDHEVHRGVVVIVQEHFIEAGVFNTCPWLGGGSTAPLRGGVLFPILHWIFLSQPGEPSQPPRRGVQVFSQVCQIIGFICATITWPRAVSLVTWTFLGCTGAAAFQRPQPREENVSTSRLRRTVGVTGISSRIRARPPSVRSATVRPAEPDMAM